MGLFMQEMGFVDEDEEDKEAKSEEEDDIRPSQLQPTVPAVPTTSAALPAAAAMPTANGLSLPAVSAVPAAAPTDPTVAAMLAAAAASGAAPVVQPVMPQYLPAQPGQQYPGQAIPQQPQNLVEAARLAAERAAAAVTGQVAPAAAAAANPALAAAQAAAMRAAALAAAFAQGGGPAVAVPAQQQQQRQPGFESELEINDFPQNARWKVTHKGFQAEITELTGAAVTTKGLYIAKGKPVSTMLHCLMGCSALGYNHMGQPSHVTLVTSDTLRGTQQRQCIVVASEMGHGANGHRAMAGG